MLACSHNFTCPSTLVLNFFANFYQQGVYRHERVESYIRIEHVFVSLGLCGALAQSRLLSDVIEQHAPAAWAHINLLGEYDFSDEKLRGAPGILPLKSRA